MEEQMHAAPRADKPRMFGGYLEPAQLPWSWAEHRLAVARNYWIATTRRDGRPHTRPVWGIWMQEAFYFSTGSLAAANIAHGSEITVHLESGDETVIVEGTVEEVADTSLIASFAQLYAEKYHWDVDAGDRPYRVRLRVAFGWMSDGSGLDKGALFHGTATRWTFS